MSLPATILVRGIDTGYVAGEGGHNDIMRWSDINTQYEYDVADGHAGGVFVGAVNQLVTLKWDGTNWIYKRGDPGTMWYRTGINDSAGVLGIYTNAGNGLCSGEMEVVECVKYYAQLGAAANIDTAELWNTESDGGGTDLDWSVTADVAKAVLNISGQDVYLNVDFTCRKIQGDTVGTGSFVIQADKLNTTRNITCEVAGGADHGVWVKTMTGETLNVTLPTNGRIYGGSTASKYGIYIEGANAAVNIIGQTGKTAVQGGHTNNIGGLYGIYNSVAYPLNITGNVRGGNGGNSSMGVRNNTTGVVTITGNVYGGTIATANGIYNISTGTYIVSGSINGGVGTNGYYALAASILTAKSLIFDKNLGSPINTIKGEIRVKQIYFDGKKFGGKIRGLFGSSSVFGS